MSGDSRPANSVASRECAYFKDQLRSCRPSQPQEPAELRRPQSRPVGKERMSALPLMLPCPPNQHAGHIDAGHAGGKRGPAHAHCGKAQLAIDEHPVAEPIDQVGGDQGESDRPDLPYALQIAPESDVYQQRQRAPVKEAMYCRGRTAHRLCDSHEGKRWGAKPTSSMAIGVYPMAR